MHIKVKKGHPYPSISWTRKGMDSVITEGPTLEFDNPLAEHQGAYFVQVKTKILAEFLLIFLNTPRFPTELEM